MLGATAVVGELAIRTWVPGGAAPSAAGFWSLSIGLILVAVDRYDAGISQLAPLYNSATLITVMFGLWLFEEWEYFGTSGY